MVDATAQPDRLLAADRALAALVDLEHRLSVSEYGSQLNYVLLIAFCALSVGLVIGGALSPLELAIVGVLVAAVILSSYRSKLLWARRKRIVDEKLNRSLVVEWLAQGPEFVDAIYHWTPAPLKWMYLPRRPRDLAESMKLLARNLDWYLEEPRPLIRESWFYTAGTLIIVFSYYVAIFAVTASSAGRYGQPFFSLFMPPMFVGMMSLIVSGYTLRAEIHAANALIDVFKRMVK